VNVLWRLRPVFQKEGATYGGLARLAGGGPMASQSITTILGKAYNQKEYSVSSIVYANGRVWMDDLHKEERLKKYKAEGISLDVKGKILDFHEKIYDPFDTLTHT
jgi:alkylated DNA nucleotide flippase Atl1